MQQEITDCVQLTLDDWMEMKKKLRLELLGVKRSFVRIGYALRKIEEGKLYERDGYKSVAEFAKGEYGLEASTVSRFMSINREYSVDGYSETLRPEYEAFGRSQLEEMLRLPEQDREMVRPETSREDIRELKRFNKEAEKLNAAGTSEPEESEEPEKACSTSKDWGDVEIGGADEPEENAGGEGDEIDRLVMDFYKDNMDTLREVREEWPEGGCQAKRLAEIVNPSGSRTYRKGFLFLMLNEKEIFTKKFGETPKQMTWEEFAKRTDEVLVNWVDEPEGKGSEPEREERREPKKARSTRKDSGDKGFEEPETVVEAPAGSSRELEDDPKGQKAEEKEIAPAQKTAKRLEEHGISEEPETGRESEEIPGQTTVYDFPEMLPEGHGKAKERRDGEETSEGQQDESKGQQDESKGRQDELKGRQDESKGRQDEPKGTYETRKKYLDGLTAWKAAKYVVESASRQDFDEDTFYKPETLLNWLLETVDGEGKTVEG